MTTSDPWLPEQPVQNVKAYIFKVVVAANDTDVQITTKRDSSGVLLGRMRAFRNPNLADGTEVYDTGAQFVDDPAFHNVATAAGTYYFVVEWNLDNAGAFKAGRSFSIARADLAKPPPPGPDPTVEPATFRGVAFLPFVNDAPVNVVSPNAPNFVALAVAVGDPHLASEPLANPGPDAFTFANYKVYAWKFQVTAAMVNFYTRTAQLYVGARQDIGPSPDLGNDARFRLYRADAFDTAGKAIEVSPVPFGLIGDGAGGTKPGNTTASNSYGLGALHKDGLAEGSWYILTLVIDAEGASGSFDPPANFGTRFAIAETTFAP